MNEYASLTQVKKELEMSLADTSKNVVFKRLLEVSSRFVDDYCKRFFYSMLATKQFNLLSTRRIFVDDLISVTSIKRVNPLTGDEVDVSNYQLEPLTDYPKTSIKKLDDYWDVDYILKVTGKWGYEDAKTDSGDTVQNDPLTSNATNLTVNDADTNDFSICQTLLLEDEQVYVQNIVDDVLTIKRQVNGTVAVQHVKNTPIYICVYPASIVQATLMQFNRFRHGLDAAPSGAVGQSEQITFEREPTLAIRVVLNPYKKVVFSS